MSGDWKVSNQFFAGTVKLEQSLIASGHTKTFDSPIENILLKTIELIPPESLGSGLEWGNISIGSANEVSVEFTNISKEIQDVREEWKVSNPFFTGKLKLIDPQPIPGGATVRVRGNIHDIQATSPFELNAPPELRVINAIAYGISFENIVSATFSNRQNTEARMETSEWTLSNDFLTATVMLGPLTIPGKSNADTRGKISGVTMNAIKNNLVSPVDLGPELQMLPSTVDSENRMSVGVRNKGTNPMSIEKKNWIAQVYDPKYTGPCQAETISSGDCLIYAFIEMESADFQRDSSGILLELKKRHNVVLTGHCSGEWDEKRCKIE
jgi:hypothetical protein